MIPANILSVQTYTFLHLKAQYSDFKPYGVIALVLTAVKSLCLGYGGLKIMGKKELLC